MPAGASPTPGNRLSRPVRYWPVRAPGAKAMGGRHKAPVQRGFQFQLVQGLARRQCALFVFSGKRRGVHQLHAGGHEQAARPAHDHQAFEAGAFHAVHDGAAALQKQVMNLGLGPAGVVGADHRIVARHGLGHLGGVQRVGGHHGQTGLCGQLGGVARQHGDLVTTAQQFNQNGATNKTCGTNECNFHIHLRCVSEDPSFIASQTFE